MWQSTQLAPVEQDRLIDQPAEQANPDGKQRGDKKRLIDLQRIADVEHHPRLIATFFQLDDHVVADQGDIARAAQ